MFKSTSCALYTYVYAHMHASIQIRRLANCLSQRFRIIRWSASTSIIPWIQCVGLKIGIVVDGMPRSMRGLNRVIPGNRLEHCWHVASTWAACRMVKEKPIEDIMETYRETKERQQRHIDKEKQWQNSINLVVCSHRKNRQIRLLSQVWFKLQIWNKRSKFPKSDLHFYIHARTKPTNMYIYIFYLLGFLCYLSVGPVFLTVLFLFYVVRPKNVAN